MDARAELESDVDGTEVAVVRLGVETERVLPPLGAGDGAD